MIDSKREFKQKESVYLIYKDNILSFYCFDSYEA